MDYKEIILNSLLTKYEKSKSYLNDVNRRIIIKADKIKGYSVENYEEKNLFHNIVKDLKRKHLIDFSWFKYEEENLLNEIWLCKENVALAYNEIGRKNPKQDYKIILTYLQNIEFKEQWINNYATDMKKYMLEKQKENILLPRDKAEEILIALKEIDNRKNVNHILKRSFSMKCYKDSKFFERNIENILVKIIKKYYNWDNLLEELSDAEILAQVGIVKYPEVVEFSGDMSFEINGEKLNFSSQSKGSYINAYTIQKMENIELLGVNKIIFIENKANYIDYIENKKEDEFVIYHGGFYSPIKGKFFEKIYNVAKNKNIKYNHWSDIDIGGFKIYTRLRDNIIPDLQPYKMDKQQLIENSKYTQTIDTKYKKMLEKLKQEEKYSIFFETIDYMIEKNIRLEQESMI